MRSGLFVKIIIFIFAANEKCFISIRQQCPVRTCGKQHFSMVEFSARAASNISAWWSFPHVRQATFRHGGVFRTCGKQHFGVVELSARAASNISARWNFPHVRKVIFSAWWSFPHVRQATFQHGGTFRACGKQHFGMVELSARAATLTGIFFNCSL
jgi:hypothetical protein